MAEIGKRYRFDYPIEFTTLPEYSARRGAIVTVIRLLTDEEAQTPNVEEGITRMYAIRDSAGWNGHAWEEELIDLA